MGKRHSNGNAALNSHLSETRARLAWSNRESGLIAALSKKETFEQTRELIFRAYEHMLRARLCDQKVITLYKQNKAHFQIGVAGHEAIQVAAALSMHKEIDYFFPYYRDMAFCAALGMTEQEFMLNCMDKEDDPNSHGRQMPMHYAHKDLHIISHSSATGTQFLQAVGFALACKRKGTNALVYVSSGEGTCAQGDFHEALNWASREKLSVVFVIQNNTYAISVPITEQIGAKNIYEMTKGYENLCRFEADGTDFFQSYDAMQIACDWARRNRGPALVEAHVIRLQGHSISDNQNKYRSKEEIEAERKRCPIMKLSQYLIANKICSAKQLEEISQRIDEEVNAAAEWADIQPDCKASDATLHTFSIDNPASLVKESTANGPDFFMIEGINRALDEEMAYNSDVFVFGQDVARGKGGVFGATMGLTEKYGDERVFNSPLAESSIVGVAIGMALQGMKPVAEIQFGDYSWYAMMQIRNELAMMHYRTRGDFSCPAVIRIPVGGYIQGGCYHSQNIEATFAHFPGLYVIYPSNATDAKGLLKSAIRSKDPVLFLEQKGLYRQIYAKGPIGDEDFVLPIGKARMAREGKDVTIVTWGALVQKSMVVAKEFEKDGVSVEVIDLRTIVPPDMAAIFESVKKTSRVLIAHEDMVFMGFGAELAAQISESCFQHLDAPVKRVGMKYCAAVPHASVLEDAVLPKESDIRAALGELLAF